MYDVELGLYIDGEWRAGEGRRTVPVVNPATEEVLADLPLASEQDIADALASSQEGFQVWRTTSAWDRQLVMERTADLIQARREQLARVLTLENGKPLVDARGEIDRVVETIRWCGEEGKRAYGRLLPPRQPELVQTTVKRPVGPVAAFAPWNFPAVLVARKLAAALAAGCSVIVKPAEETPGVCIGVIRAFIDAGLPKGVINMLFGEPSQVSDLLIASPVTRKVSFTGSVSVGRLLSTLAAKQLKPVTMELGGHSPVIVFDDVDVQAVARACAGFKFRNAGQVCVSASRFFVHERVYESFTRHFVEFANAVKVGSGLENGISMGPLANARRLQSTIDLVDDAKARGATVAAGGNRLFDRGYFFQPTVLTDLDSQSRILHEEPFCPVAPIMPFNDFDEVMQRANGVDFGLAAYAFTQSIKRAAEVSEAFDAGWIGINSFTPALADAPISGTKQSGIGHEGGPEGLDAYLQTRFVSQASAV
ncbi:NAD-dependent succinate-semialdehyde dehydrogenase [Pseudomonas juntendi]|uniref:NAD-dependent succinate-semialdehyde dehydrogenase n=1 Tax=Pseudomonas juntendi TaxID=2666183 RepID=UPI001F38B277|nr:NAD-dependent succinate-semialdehyde dehydrogenase [Pseudomonas juntendi]MCO7054891.1 NAD-dependent succinate-semialdehyde dehydrogenase [Pseudomonas juntendi]UJM14741.1 NAD-dependent succinate-semialdehyde dehydrogenase [Pseudomonas juntendi]